MSSMNPSIEHLFAFMSTSSVYKGTIGVKSGKSYPLGIHLLYGDWIYIPSHDVSTKRSLYRYISTSLIVVNYDGAGIVTNFSNRQIWESSPITNGVT